MNENYEASPNTGGVKGFLKSKKFLRPLLGIVIGAIAGYLYYYFVGCNSGSCAITSNAYSTVFLGVMFGYFILGSPCSSSSSSCSTPKE